MAEQVEAMAADPRPDCRVRIKSFSIEKAPPHCRRSMGCSAPIGERETYDMYGILRLRTPHPKRLLMPEDWKGWPLRKDYVQPDFYEMQDAY